jgi:CRISPR-associated Csx2 family protein
MATLVSFLGKSQLDHQHGYRETTYRFSDGAEYRTAYFGSALAQQIGADRVLLLGTASSMWDYFVEAFAGDTAQEALRIELMDAVRAGSVTESLLESLTPMISARLGRQVQALIIPAAAQFAEQQNILERLAAPLRRGEAVALDVTHGYRHLAMLALAAARYLAHHRDIQVRGIYYGALDMTADGITPVVALDGLDHVQRWGEALAAHEASGRYDVFADLLVADGLSPEAAAELRRGDALLQLGNIHDAATHLREAVRALQAPLRGASELFRERILKSARWAEADRVSEKQRLLALQALRRGDVLRAAALGLEAFLSREVEASGGNPLQFSDKKRIDEQFGKEAKEEGQHPDWKRNAYWLLKNVRNACVHGTTPAKKQLAPLMGNPDRLRRELEAALNRLTNT